MRDVFVTGIDPSDEYGLHVAIATAFGGGSTFPLYRIIAGTATAIVRQANKPLGQPVWLPAEGAEADFDVDVYAAVNHGRKRVSLKADTERVDWFRRKAASHGFELLQQPVVRTRNIQVDRGRKAGEPSFWFQRSTFIGRLRVTDGERFSTTMHHGIGRMRAFGCGLMLISTRGAGNE